MLPVADVAWGIVVAGVGGTGVITIGSLLGMAAHLENRASSRKDAAGLAQKGGATGATSRSPTGLTPSTPPKVDTAKADLVIGATPSWPPTKATLAVLQPGRTFVALNTHRTPTASFVNNPNWQFPDAHCDTAITSAWARRGSLTPNRWPRSCWATASTPTAAAGLRLAKGRVPLTLASLMRAMELNGVQVENNKAAFEWGRRCAHDLPAVQALFQAAAQVIQFVKKPALADMIAKRVDFLTGYQNAAYAADYQAFVQRCRPPRPGWAPPPA